MVDTNNVLVEARRYVNTLSYTPLNDGQVEAARGRTWASQRENDMEHLAKAPWEDDLFELLLKERLPGHLWQDVVLHLYDTVLAPLDERSAA